MLLESVATGVCGTDGIVTDVVGLEDHAAAPEAVRSPQSVKAVVAARRR